jgi:hypothetical protein
MIRLFMSVAALTLSVLVADAQPKPKATPVPASPPESRLTRADIETHTRFLASDELQGRRTGEPGNATAARYIAEQFRAAGLKPAVSNASGQLAGQPEFLQRIVFERVGAASAATMIVGKDTLRFGKELLVMAGGAARLTAQTVYAGYGLTDGEDGYNKRDVQGKIVIVQGGSPDAKSPQQIFGASRDKRRMASTKGAAALVELYSEAIPWGLVSQFFSREQISMPASGSAALSQPSTSMPHLWANNQNNVFKQFKTDNLAATLSTSGRSRTPAPSANVAGIVEGTDPVLKNEFVVLSAHFDHVGVGKQGGNAYTATDSIFNGARDNAIGATALLAAAKALQQQPPKRSVLIVALTGEEVGLLGSQYYAEHPLVPLKQTIFNFNIDGAGYNDPTIVSVVGLDRTGARSEIEAACRAYGLSVVADPAPEQGLFDRSDNVSFAAKGIPAPTFSLGFKDFNEEIMKYYHQVSDEASSLDFDYVQRFCQAYVYAARLIANRATRPVWAAGDKYEAAAKALYGN